CRGRGALPRHARFRLRLRPQPPRRRRLDGLLMVEEARMEDREGGRVAVSEGWFVVNVRDAAWMTNEYFGAACVFEGDEVGFDEVGFTIGVLQPGRSGGLYHRESNQEDFLVLAGECVLVVEGEERRLQAGGFFHCPAG